MEVTCCLGESGVKLLISSCRLWSRRGLGWEGSLFDFILGGVCDLVSWLKECVNKQISGITLES